MRKFIYVIFLIALINQPALTASEIESTVKSEEKALVSSEAVASEQSSEVLSQPVSELQSEDSLGLTSEDSEAISSEQPDSETKSELVEANSEVVSSKQDSVSSVGKSELEEVNSEKQAKSNDKQTAYNSDGSIKSISYYSNNHISKIEYYENGKLDRTCYYTYYSGYDLKSKKLVIGKSGSVLELVNYRQSGLKSYSQIANRYGSESRVSSKTWYDAHGKYTKRETWFGTKTGNRQAKVSKYRNGVIQNTINYTKSGKVASKTFYSNGKISRYEEWFGTTTNNRKKRVVKHYSNGTKKSSVIYMQSGKVDAKYWYNTKGHYTKYENWSGTKNNNRKTQVKNYRDGVIQDIIDYASNGKVKAKYFYNSKGKRTKSEIWAGTSKNNRKKQISIYYSNGKMKQQVNYDSKYKYTKVDSKSMWDSKGHKTVSEDWNNGKKIKAVKYEYTKSGKLSVRRTYRNGKLRQKDLFSKGYLTETRKYDVRGNKIETATYYPNSSLKNKKLRYTADSHYQKNNVKTGVTETWYTKSGKVSKIDARTFPTYYSQYTPVNHNYFCPEYNRDMYAHGCILNSFAMQYSVYFNDELTPIEIMNQGYSCFSNPEHYGRRNGLNTHQVKRLSDPNYYDATFRNEDNVVPNGKSTFTISEAIRDYGMPVQLMVRSDGHRRMNFPGHSVLAYRYTYENGKAHIYVEDPGATGQNTELANYMVGHYNEVGVNYYTIEKAWVGGVK